MSSIDRFDPVEQRIAAAIDDVAAARRPDYLNDILRQTARSRQRPRWTFPERWLPLDSAMTRTVPLTKGSGRALLLLLVLILLAAVAVITVVGARNRVPPPFGPAANGQLAFAQNGQIFLSDRPGGQAHLLVGDVKGAASPVWSPDGKRFYFGASINGDGLEVADADGSHLRVVVGGGLALNAAWAPDSATLALKNEQRGTSWLFLGHADGTPPTPLALGKGTFALDEMAFRPPDGRELLVRAQLPDNTVALLLVDTKTGRVTNLGLPSKLVFGPEYDLSGISWSPDGARLAYNVVDALPGAEPSGHFRVHVVNADGSGDVALPGPADPAVQEAWPAFSPDGRWILVHRWTWKSSDRPEGWLAVMPADGSAPARDIGPRIPGGEDTGLIKIWSPDGTRVLMRTGNTQVVYSIDPVTGNFEQLPWSTTELPDWQRLAP